MAEADASFAADATRRRALFRFAAFAVSYYLVVIVWGSWVRIAGAGAGCGDHWPLCNGDVVPVAGGEKTWIEYTHRLSSALAGPVGLLLLIAAFRATKRGDRLRVAAVLQLVFLGVEGLIGAALVKGRLVVDDDSVARAIVMALHLVNTYALVGAAALCAYWSRVLPDSRTSRVSPALWVAGALLLVVSASGAVTALGDTVFPPSSRPSGEFTERFTAFLDPGVHFLMRLLVLHPILSVVTGGFVIWAALRHAPGSVARQLTLLILVQLAFGTLNVWLKAPGWAQLVHLILAELGWLAYVVAVANARESAPVFAGAMVWRRP